MSYYEKFMTPSLKMVSKCPRKGCCGKLRFQQNVNGDPWFKCWYCNLGFIVTNPRSFGPEYSPRAVKAALAQQQTLFKP